MEVLAGVFLILWIVAGFFVGVLCQSIVVPVLAQMLSKDRFAEASAFDACTLPIASAVLSIVLPLFLSHIKWHPLWTLPLLTLGFTLCGLAYLWIRGWSGGGKGWAIEEGRAVKLSSKTTIDPLFVWQRSDYHQTDAYSGWSDYYLDLHDADGLIASNGYRAEEVRDEALDALLEVAPGCRVLDLVLVWRAEPLRWMEFAFSEQWVPLLCGDLARLDNEERDWWRQWIHPTFSNPDEVLVDPREWSDHLASLRIAYPEFWEQGGRLTPLDSHNHWYESLLPQLRERVFYLDQLLDEAAHQQVFAMKHKTYKGSYLAVMGEGGTLAYSASPWLELKPRRTREK